MIRGHALVLLLLAMACSSPRPPAGPVHVPTDSTEAKTACPDQRAKAQGARENLLGEDLSSSQGAELQQVAAEAVLRHGECEAEAMAALPAVQGNHDQILAKLRALREQVQTATLLLQEVGRYQEGLLSLRAGVVQAALKLDFANKVSALTPPEDLDLQTRSAFEAELSSASQVLRLEAAALLESLIASIKDTPEASTLLPRACQLLRASGSSASECP